MAKSFRRSDDVNHDITSVHDGDYWRLLTPGEYEIIAVADGYEPVAKLVEVNYLHSNLDLTNLNIANFAI